MVMYKENAQGFFEFDVNALSEITNIEFVNMIIDCLTFKSIEKIYEDETDKHYTLIIIGTVSVEFYYFNKLDNNIIYSAMPNAIVKKAGGYLIENE